MEPSPTPTIPIFPKQPAVPEDVWRRTSVLYLLMFVASLLFAGFLILLVFKVRPTQDNTALIVPILGFLGAGLPGCMALVKAAETGQSVKEIHVAFNSRMDEFLRQTKALGQMQGREMERSVGTPIADAATATAAAVAEAAVKTAQATAQAVVAAAEEVAARKLTPGSSG